MNKKELAKNQLSTEASTDQELVETVVDAIQELKGKDIVVMDLRRIAEASAAFFIVCHGTSSTHLSGIVDRVEKNIWEKIGERPTHVEGKRGGQWVLVDYFTVVVHVFDEQRREFYDLEGLWSDAKITRFKDV